MTNDQLVLVLGFASTTAATLAGIVTNLISSKASAKKADQAIATRALEIQEQNLELAKAAALRVESAARALEQRTSAAHEEITAKLDKQNAVMEKQTVELEKNTKLTEIGNDIKTDIVKNQIEIAELKKAKD